MLACGGAATLQCGSGEVRGEDTEGHAVSNVQRAAARENMTLSLNANNSTFLAEPRFCACEGEGAQLAAQGAARSGPPHPSVTPASRLLEHKNPVALGVLAALCSSCGGRHGTCNSIWAPSLAVSVASARTDAADAGRAATV